MSSAVGTDAPGPETLTCEVPEIVSLGTTLNKWER